MYKVLLVDDEVFVRKGLRNLINWNACGFEICGEAENGTEAFNWITKNRPELVITDIRMPVLGGLELISKVTETGMDAVSFIILSGYGDFKYAQQAVRYNVHDYILKPIDEEELKSALLKLSEQLRFTREPLTYVEADRSLVLLVTERMEENDAEAVRRAVEQLIKELQAKRMAAEAVGRTVARLIASVTETIIGMNGNPDELKTLDGVSSWNAHADGLDTLRQRLTGFSLEGAALIGELRRDKLQGSILKIKSHIEGHFRENISLRSIAGQYYMNPVYMGQLFRKTYGLYFNEFLLGLRIREAKKLLRQTELRIYEVAEKAGFSSSNYFVTQFEKLERMTPSDYRNRLLGNGGAYEKLE